MKITCRVCRIQQGEFFTFDSIVTINGHREYKLLEIYNNCFQLNAFLEDTLPHVVCLSCFEKLKDFFKFRLQAEESDHQFRVNLQGKSLQEAQKVLDTCIVPTLSESKLEEPIKADDEVAVEDEEELEHTEEIYDINESTQGNESEEIEDTDILFELYNKNDSCMERYLNLEKDKCEDTIEDCDQEDNCVSKLLDSNNILYSPTGSPEHINTNPETVLSKIEISRIESPVCQVPTAFLQPLVELRKWQCVDCGRKYLTEEKLLQHGKLHKPLENCECEICG